MISLSSCYFGTKILAISCFHCLQNNDVIKFALFCPFFYIPYNNRNRHHQLSLHTKFQLNILFCYQDIVSIMLSLSLNDDVIKIDLFCKLIRILLIIIKISLKNIFKYHFFRLKFYFVTKVLAISCFHCL